jgi:tetratricopeptide (TPR) repeat protein
LIRSFAYDAPRPEICAEIGYYHKQTRDFKKALQWFGLATKLADTESMGFVLWDYRGYIPNIECCVCCVELGEYENAHEYNECAAEFKPDSPAIEFNRKVLAKKLAE